MEDELEQVPGNLSTLLRIVSGRGGNGGLGGSGGDGEPNEEGSNGGDGGNGNVTIVSSLLSTFACSLSSVRWAGQVCRQWR